MSVGSAFDDAILHHGQVEIVGHEPGVRLASVEPPSGNRLRERPLYARSAYAAEMNKISVLSALADEGEALFNTVYVYRSLSKSAPSVKNDWPTEDRFEAYNHLFRIFLPEIQKISIVQEYNKRAVEYFISCFQDLAQNASNAKKQGAVLSDQLLASIVSLFDTLIQIDVIKDAKACLNNDLSFFKRVLPNVIDENLRRTVPSEEELIDLNGFLATRSFSMDRIQGAIKKINGYERIILLLVGFCVESFEAEFYVLPEEKHRYVRFCTYALRMIRFDDPQSPELLKLKKEFKTDRLVKMLRQHPIVPIMADTTLNVATVLPRSSLYSEDWNIVPRPDADSKRHMLTTHLAEMLETFSSYSARFSLAIKALEVDGSSSSSRRASTAAGSVGSGNSKHPLLMLKEDKNLCIQVSPLLDLLIEGLRILCLWKARVAEQAAWKYSFAAPETVSDDGQAAGVYERVVKLNYSSEDRFALVQAIALIKGLDRMLSEQGVSLRPFVAKAIYDEMQQFTQFKLPDVYIKCKKNKRDCASLVTELLAIGADWSTGSLPSEETFKDNYKTRASTSKPMPPLRSRDVAPSCTRLLLLRMLSGGLVSGRNANRKKDLSKQAHVDWISGFYRRSVFYPYLLSLSDVLAAASDLSDLYFREFYLEMAKQVHFPIEQSLPWIITREILEPPGSPSELPYAVLMDKIFYPLLVYNDAGMKSLAVYKRKFLYDEIQLEANLVFAQLMYMLAEHVFLHCKSVASSRLLPAEFRDNLPDSEKEFVPLSGRYLLLCRHRHMTLLGRSIDVCAMLVERFNEMVRQDVFMAIEKFRSMDLTFVVEFAAMLRHARETHAVLSEYCEQRLDPFEDILNEVSDSFTRILEHVSLEFEEDLFPTFVYDSYSLQLTRARVIFVPERRRPHPSPVVKTLPSYYLFGQRRSTMAFQTIYAPFRAFFGQRHVDALFEVVSFANVPTLADVAVGYLDRKLRETVPGCLQALRQVFPGQTRPPALEQGIAPTCDALLRQLDPLMRSDALQQDFFDSMRCVGNALAFLVLMDAQISWTSTQRTIFHGHVGGTPGDEVRRVLEKGLGFVQAEERQRRSLLAGALLRIRTSCGAFLQQELVPAESVFQAMRGADSSKEFYRIYSSSLLWHCYAEERKGIFGDSCVLTGCVLLHLMEQRSRFSLFGFVQQILNSQMLKPLTVSTGASTKEAKQQLQQEMATYHKLVDAAHALAELETVFFSLLDTVLPSALTLEMQASSHFPLSSRDPFMDFVAGLRAAGSGVTETAPPHASSSSSHAGSNSGSARDHQWRLSTRVMSTTGDQLNPLFPSSFPETAVVSDTGASLSSPP